MKRLDLEEFRRRLTDAPLGIFQVEQLSYRLIPAALDPFVVPCDAWHDVQRDCRLIFEAYRKLVSHIRVKRPPLAELVFGELKGIEYEAAWRKDQSDSLAAIRFDLFFDGDVIRVIEVNTTIPAMHAYSDMIVESYIRSLKEPSAECDRLLNEASNTLALLHSLLGLYSGKKNHPVIGIVARAGDSQMAELLWYKNHWGSAGFECLVCTPEDLVWRNDYFMAHGRKIDLIYRHIFANKVDPRSDFGKALAQAVPAHIFNPVAAHFELKGLLALLSTLTESEAYDAKISEDALGAVKLRVPWTRILTAGFAKLFDGIAVDLVPWVAQNPRGLVLKSSVGYGGHRVILGDNYGDPMPGRKQFQIANGVHLDWKALVQELASGRFGVWIVQICLSGFKREQTVFRDGVVATETNYLDCSLFADSGQGLQYGGASRFHANQIVNIGTGGGLVPFFSTRHGQKLLALPDRVASAKPNQVSQQE